MFWLVIYHSTRKQTRSQWTIAKNRNLIKAGAWQQDDREHMPNTHARMRAHTQRHAHTQTSSHIVKNRNLMDFNPPFTKFSVLYPHLLYFRKHTLSFCLCVYVCLLDLPHLSLLNLWHKTCNYETNTLCY